MEVRQQTTDKAHTAQIEDITTSTNPSVETPGTEETPDADTVLATLKHERWAVIWCCYAIWVVLVVAFDFAAPPLSWGCRSSERTLGTSTRGIMCSPRNGSRHIAVHRLPRTFSQVFNHIHLLECQTVVPAELTWSTYRGVVGSFMSGDGWEIKSAKRQ
jgi:hypothetical protein